MQQVLNHHELTYHLTISEEDDFCEARKLTSKFILSLEEGSEDRRIATQYLEKFEDREAIWKAMEQAHLTGRLGRPEEVVWLVVFLASDEASFMNGSVVTVDGGYSCV